MKKFIVILAAVVIAATVWATNQVTSINVAGYVKATLNRGQYSMLRYDFFMMDGSPTVSNIFGSQLPVGSKVFRWTGSGYATEEFKIKIGPPPTFLNLGTNWTPGTNHLDLGAGFWAYVPPSAPQATYTLNLMGEVPNNPTSTIPILGSYNLIGYSYPTDIMWKDTALAQNAAVGDKVFFWNGGGYDSSEFKIKIGPPPTFLNLGTNWTGVGTSYVVRVGNGFWFQATSGRNWTETRPYNLD